jgi:hypothetical protein
MSDDEQISRVMSEMGRRGGVARAQALTAEQRRESAAQASNAAAKARTRAAKERKLLVTHGSVQPALKQRQLPTMRRTVPAWARIGVPERRALRPWERRKS